MNSAVSRASLLNALFLLGMFVTLLMTVYASTGGLFPGDTSISHSIQGVEAEGAGTMATVLNATFDAPTLIGITAVLSLLLGVLGYYPQMILLAATILAQAANAILKLVVDRPRPDDSLVRVTEQANGLSFPSGHTMGTVVFFGVIFYLSFQLIKSRPLRYLVQVLALSQMLAIGFSRVYTGAHWPSDVLGGFLWGTWFVVALVTCYRRFHPRLTERWSAA